MHYKSFSLPKCLFLTKLSLIVISAIEILLNTEVSISQTPWHVKIIVTAAQEDINICYCRGNVG
jgi:hypothetical protein